MELQGRVITKSLKEEEKPASSPSQNYVIGLTSLAFIILCAFFSAFRLNPPDAQPNNAPVTEFSSGRAMERLKVIARMPHPVGTAGHTEVQNYIFKELSGLGLYPEIQKATILNRKEDGSYVAATVQNVIGKIEGVDHGKAILLTCHYDSTPTGPGASDDGAGVAALLETIRALKTNSSLKNDLLFLFTDGEELGMLGAKAFMDEHPRAKDVAVVLNFEARGVGGPSIMFETSEGNGGLIEEFAKAAPRPVANSLTYDLYKLLGNDTDLTVFKRGGLQGLNFAYIMGGAYYHTARDSYENIDERSLQHHGSYALALARRFGDGSNWPRPSSNAIYFDLLGSFLVSYSEKWVLPLMTLTLTLFVGVVILGLRMKRITFRGTAFGTFSFLLNVVSVAVAMIITLSLIQRVGSGSAGESNNNLYAIGFLFLTVAISGALLAWFSKKTRMENLTVGALLWWNVLMIPVCLLAPGGSYLIVWPLLSAVLALGTVFTLRESMTSAKGIVIGTFPALCSVILIAPLIRLMMAGFGLGLLWALNAFIVFLIGLCIVHLSLLIAHKKWLLPLAAGLLGLCFVGAGVLMSDVSSDNPKMDHIFYALNADTNKALWGSFDQKSDQWTAQFLSSGPEKANLSDHFPWGRGAFLKGDAPVLSLSPPNVAVLADSAKDGVRSLRLRITSPRKAPALSIYWKRELRLEAFAVNERRILENRSEAANQPTKYRRFSYFGLPEGGVEVTLEVKSSDPLELIIEELSYGLPETPNGRHTGRPDYLIAAPVLYSDSTIITKTLTF